jgi:Rieske Fe-S protein
MSKQKPLSRKYFIQILTGLIFSLLIWIWYRITAYQNDLDNQIEFRHGDDVPMGMSYYDKYYLYRNGSGMRAFSTTCTHAGCRLGKSNGAMLHCSCHGSQFNALTGEPIKGPAFKTLQEFECKFESSSGQWVVKLSPVKIDSKQL